MTEERKSRHFEFSKVENGYLVSELPESNIGSPYYSVKRYAFETIESLFQWMRGYFENKNLPNQKEEVVHRGLGLPPFFAKVLDSGRYCVECTCGSVFTASNTKEFAEMFSQHLETVSKQEWVFHHL